MVIFCLKSHFPNHLSECCVFRSGVCTVRKSGGEVAKQTCFHGYGPTGRVRAGTSLGGPEGLLHSQREGKEAAAEGPTQGGLGGRNGHHTPSIRHQHVVPGPSNLRGPSIHLPAFIDSGLQIKGLKSLVCTGLWNKGKRGLQRLRLSRGRGASFPFKPHPNPHRCP